MDSSSHSKTNSDAGIAENGKYEDNGSEIECNGDFIFAELCNKPNQKFNAYDFGNDIEITAAKDKVEKERKQRLPTQRTERQSKTENILSSQSIYACIGRTCCKKNCLAIIDPSAEKGDLRKSFSLVEHFRQDLAKISNERTRLAYLQKKIEGDLLTDYVLKSIIQFLFALFYRMRSIVHKAREEKD